jgi:drug/metabolite transporter (DMT)-like permease
MFRALFRVLFGFILACLAAGLTTVLFATGPDYVLGGDPDKITKFIDWVLASATHSAVFSAPFAFIAAAISEWQTIRNWAYHALAGLAISVGGFVAQMASEAQGAPSIVNNYALTAYLTTGFLAGLTYWLFAGRSAGHADTVQFAANNRTGGGTTPQQVKRPTPAAPPASRKN